MMVLALLMPALNQARESAKVKSCSSQIRQVGMATLMLADDHNGWLDGTNDHTSWVTPPGWSWPFCITNYLGGGRMVLRRDAGGIGCPGMDSRDMRDYPYGINQFFGSLNGYGGIPRHSIFEAKRPSMTFLLAECWFPLVTWSGGPWPVWDGTANGRSTWDLYPRHREAGLNFFFLDGHVSWLRARGYLGISYDSAQQSDWWIWAQLNGLPTPYTPEWWPLSTNPKLVGMRCTASSPCGGFAPDKRLELCGGS